MPLVLDRVDAVVLAGGGNAIALPSGEMPAYSALLPFGHSPAIGFILAALRQVPQVGRICVVGSEATLRPALGDAADGLSFVPAGDTLIESMYRGLAHFADSRMVLLTTGDVPLITPAAILAFLANCRKVETTFPENLFLPVVPRGSFTGAFSQITQGFSRFRDLSIRYGNLMLADPRLRENPQITRRMNALFRSTMTPITSALAFGLGVGLSYVLGVHLWHLLSLEQMARLASSRFALGLIPVVTEYPEITLDIENSANYAFAQAQMASRQAAG